MNGSARKPTWVRKAPAHWALTRFRYLGEFVGGGTPPKTNLDYWDGDIPWVSPKDMKSFFITDSEDHITEIGLKNSPCRLVPSDSLLMVVRSGILRNKLPVACNSIPVALNQDMRALIANPHVSARFLHYFIQGCENELLSHWCKDGSTVESVEHDLLASTWIALPTHDEQIFIADFLDSETSKIDRLIAMRQRQMELLREQRAALIQEAVTRGLDPNVRFKDSRVPWLGKIPEHWKVMRNKYIFREIDCRSVSGQEELLTVSHITGITPRAEKDDVSMFLAESHEGYKVVEIGDLVINTMWAWMGALGFSRLHGIVSPSYNVYRPINDTTHEYYDCLFRSPVFVKEITRHSTGIWESRLRLYPQAFFEIRSPVPPIDEQQQIMDFVEAQTGRTADVISVFTRQIELLQEYRAALIHEAVTGQRPIPE